MTEFAPRKHGLGVLFKNTRKEKPTHPDWTGDITLDGAEYWLSGWVKESKAGMKYLSVAVGQEKKPKEETKKEEPSVPFDI